MTGALLFSNLFHILGGMLNQSRARVAQIAIHGGTVGSWCLGFSGFLTHEPGFSKNLRNIAFWFAWWKKTKSWDQLHNSQHQWLNCRGVEERSCCIACLMNWLSYSAARGFGWTGYHSRDDVWNWIMVANMKKFLVQSIELFLELLGLLLSWRKSRYTSDLSLAMDGFSQIGMLYLGMCRLHLICVSCLSEITISPYAGDQGLTFTFVVQLQFLF
jgi:hypothetical protein